MEATFGERLSKTPTWVYFWGAVQFAYGTLLLILRLLDPPELRNEPGMLMGIPFLLIGWGLWKRKRWSLWLGLLHSALLPLTMACGGEVMGYRSIGSGPYAGVGLMILYLCVSPFWLFNILVFAILVLRPSLRTQFEKPNALGRWHWRLRSMLLLCLAVTALLGDYAIQQRRIQREQQQIRRWEGSMVRWQRELAALVDEFVRAAESSDESAIVAARAKLVQHGGGNAAFDLLLSRMPHSREDVRLEIIATLKALDSGLPSQEALGCLGSLVEIDREAEVVQASLLDLVGEITLANGCIELMQDPRNDDATRQEAAGQLVRSELWDWRGRGRGAKLTCLRALLLAKDPEVKNTLPPMVALLDDDRDITDWERVHALCALELLGGLGISAGQSVRACLDDKSCLVQARAAGLLLQWGHDEIAIISTLRTAILQLQLNGGWDYEDARIHAIKSVTILASKAESVSPELKQFARDLDIEIPVLRKTGLPEADPLFPNQ